MWSPEEQKVIESPYWELLVEQAASITKEYNSSVSFKKALDNATIAYHITGEEYRYVHIIVDGKELLLLGNEVNNPYGKTNKVVSHYRNLSNKAILELIAIKYQELKHGL